MSEKLILNKSDKNKILQTFINSFNAMPNWLKNTLIVTLIIGVFYFGFIRKEIIYGKEKQKMEEVNTQISTINKKIEKIEEIRVANEDMLFNIEEVRGITESLSELHNSHMEIISAYLQKTLSPTEFLEYMNQINRENSEYREKVNSLFEKKSKEHLRSDSDIIKK